MGLCSGLVLVASSLAGFEVAVPEHHAANLPHSILVEPRLINDILIRDNRAILGCKARFRPFVDAYKVM